MSEETQTLLTKAVLGELSETERERWETLCRDMPELSQEAEELGGVARHLDALVEAAEDRLSPPAEVPASLLAKLESARRQDAKPVRAAARTQRRQTANEPGMLKKFLIWLGGGDEMPSLAFGAVATLMVLASVAGWWFWQGQHPGAPIVKDVVVSPDLTILTPDAETQVLDPSIQWWTFNPQPAEVSVLSPDGEEVLFSKEEALPPAKWEHLEARSSEATLKAGQTYLLRIRQGETVSERIIRVAAEARPLSAWISDPENGLAQATDWLEQGRPGDALILSSALSATYKDGGAGFNKIRGAALKAAMSGDSAESKNP